MLSMSMWQAEAPQRNIAWSHSAYYPDFTPATVKAVVGQVLCMISEYHLACASMGSTTTSPILPEQLSISASTGGTMPIQVAQASQMCESVTTSPTACV